MNAVGQQLFVNSNPTLAPYAMEVIAAFSGVEQNMLRIFLRLAGGNETDATTMYMALDGDGPKTAVFKALAKQKLEAAALEMFNALLKKVGSVRKERNKIAHWSWGFSPNLPDDLLLMDSRCLTIASDKIFVYTKRDFEDLANRIHVVSTCCSRFSHIVAAGSIEGLPPPLLSWLRTELGFRDMEDYPA
ncbi:hypothetical protein LB562_32330 [Mesorhizobium sp. B263B1A]|nr:hypothetical protein [Mesorhizobium sp. B263B1A]MCA0029134.1 hypothetical protein [Mesorhizobium sp. B263B1A]